MMEKMNEDIPIIEINKVTPHLKNMPKIEETTIKSTETDEGEPIAVHIEETEEFIEDIPFV
jgi:hypothetical protein